MYSDVPVYTQGVYPAPSMHIPQHEYTAIYLHNPPYTELDMQNHVPVCTSMTSRGFQVQLSKENITITDPAPWVVVGGAGCWTWTTLLCHSSRHPRAWPEGCRRATPPPNKLTHHLTPQCPTSIRVILPLQGSYNSDVRCEVDSWLIENVSTQDAVSWNSIKVSQSDKDHAIKFVNDGST